MVLVVIVPGTHMGSARYGSAPFRGARQEQPSSGGCFSRRFARLSAWLQVAERNSTWVPVRCAFDPGREAVWLGHAELHPG